MVLGTIGAGVGLAAAIASRFLPNLRIWRITNTDTGETVEGDFEAVGISRTVSASYAEHKTLGQFKPLTQFLGGNSDKLTFQARVYQSHAFDNVEEKFQRLIAWVLRDPDRFRPPIVLFSVGDASPVYFDNALAVIEGISDITYDSPTVTGAVRGITFTINLKEYTEYSLENVPAPESRFARAKAGEYMELITQHEYSNPLLGDVIRKRHPDLQIVQAADIVKLPSLEAIKNSIVEPKSIALKTSLGRKSTVQKTLHEFHFDRTNRTFRSTIVPTGL